MERWDKPYRLRLFSPIEGELCPSDRMMEENISLTAYEMELYEELIRDSLKQAELLGENNGKLWQYFSDEIQMPNIRSLSLEVESYGGRLWSVLQAESFEKLTHEEVQRLSETWEKLTVGGFIKELRGNQVPVPEGTLTALLGNEGLDYFVLPEKVLKGTAHLLTPALEVEIFSKRQISEVGYSGANITLPTEDSFLRDTMRRAYVDENEAYRIEFCGRWPDFLVDALNQTGSITLEEANVLAYLVSYMDTLQMETYEAAIQMRQEEKIDVPPTIKELINLCYNLDCYEFRPGIRNDRELGDVCLDGGISDWIDRLSDDVVEHLDPEKVGMEQRREEQGVFTSKGYAFPNARSRQDMYDGKHLPDISGISEGIFSLRIVSTQHPEETGVWLELPATEREFQWTLNALQERNFKDCIIAEGRSPISWCDLETDEDIEKLNELAKRIQNFPDNRMHCKYAAALELESCDGLDLALDIAENLDCYDFDPHIYSPKTYGNYILQEAGVDLQDPAFLNFHFYGYGLRQLGKAGHVCTTYGVIRRNEIPFQHEYTALQPGMKME